MDKTIVLRVISLTGLYGLGFVCGGSLWAFGITAFVLAGTLFVTRYERARPETAPTEASRQAALAALECFLSLYSPRAIRQSGSLWQMLGRSVLLVLLWPMLFGLPLMRWLWSE